MNKPTQKLLPDQAELQYEDGNFSVMRPGKFVLCAISGKTIALDDLKYWNVVLQEAYFSAEEASLKWKMLNKKS